MHSPTARLACSQRFADVDVDVHGDVVYHPRVSEAIQTPEATVISSFDELGFDPPILRAIAEAGYTQPMPVQTLCARPILEGRDLVVRSQTGSGKTAAFAAPLLQRVSFEGTRPQALVLAPTRELAIQDHSEFEKLGRYTNMRSVVIYGGTGFTLQLSRLAEGCHIVVGTPGRILDHYRRRTLDLSEVRILVLDEADEMLSAGFYEEVQKIFQAVRKLDQVCLFSATLPPNIERMIGRYMRTPVSVDLSSDHVAVDRIENVAYELEPMGSRLHLLVSVLESEDPSCAIIFCNTKSDTEMVTTYLRRRGYDAAMLNGDLPQASREEVLGKMRAGTQRLLVATDIAARGIDISFLPCVINFVPPADAESYIHRTGRTGRVDRRGRAITLVGTLDRTVVRRLKWQYGVSLKKCEVPSREETLKMLADRRIREIKERMEKGIVIPDEFRAMAQEILTDPEAESLVALLVDRYLAEPPMARKPITEESEARRPAGRRPRR